MAADSQAAPDSQETEVDAPVVRRRPVSDIGFDAKLAPTCMIWSMVASIGLLILTAIFWGVSNLPLIFR